MIELKEIVNKPTEADVKNIFTDVFGQAKVLQGLLTDVFEEYIYKHAINCDDVEISISPNMVVLRMGEYMLFHETREWVAHTRRGE